ncbi:MAG: flagellar basal body protein, partial [Pseudomonadota bacterium]|nr:flagellar basal body protein [Pseudomonadota bacterium]
MSLSSTLSNALSGLTVASRKAELVSSNVANASTDGYGRRVMETTAASIGGRGAGVEIVGVSRIVDAQVLEDRRLAGADLAASQTNLTFWTNLELAIGDVESDYGLSGRLNSFETALVEAASRPDSDVRLQNVLDSATALSDALNSVSDEIQ